VLATLACGVCGVAGSNVLGAVLAGPAAADTALDVQISQTASSLEALAVAFYGAALGLGPEGVPAPAYRALAGIAVEGARDTLTAFATDAIRRHTEHKKAFQALTTTLDPNAKVQDAPNPKFLPLLAGADLSSPEKVVDLAALVEKVAIDTYLLDLTMLADANAKAVMAGIMAVQAQHLATLRMVGALLQGGVPQLVAVPFPVTRMKDLPPAAATAAFPDALHVPGGADLIAEPTSGALR
jgi:hypothetical protein